MAISEWALLFHDMDLGFYEQNSMAKSVDVEYWSTEFTINPSMICVKLICFKN